MTHGSGAEMVPEVSAAAGFVCRLLRGRGRLSDAQLQVFRDCLAQALSGTEKHCLTSVSVTDSLLNTMVYIVS